MFQPTRTHNFGVRGTVSICPAWLLNSNFLSGLAAQRPFTLSVLHGRIRVGVLSALWSILEWRKLSLVKK